MKDPAAGRHRPARARMALPALLMAAGVDLAAAPAAAQVREPNGISVPVTVANGEITLQSYFDAQTEAIDAVTQAAAEPGVFQPLCDFQATLVLSQLGAQAGIAWYNVPANDPTAPPAQVYEIVPPGTPVGQVITSADVRSIPPTRAA